MVDENVLSERRGHVTWLTLNRPEKLNAIDQKTNRELFRAWEAFEADDQAWVAVITGAGTRAFSAGADMRAPRTSPEDESGVPSTPVGMGGGLAGIGGRRANVTKPVIAAVNGYCLGAAFELALACDLIVASDNAVFGFPEGRVNLGTGVAHRAPRQLPLKVAMSLFLTGRHMGVEEALRLGLVSASADSHDELMALADKWANDVLQNSPLYTRAVKQAVMSRLGYPLDVAIDTRFPLAEQARASRDAAEGVAAFRERRSPQWTGR